MGAALAVFGSPSQQPFRPGQRQVLELSAAKSSVGHAEPAAGAAGMLRAAFHLHSGSATGIMHLLAVNPYIAGSLEQLRLQQAQQGTAPLDVWMPRSRGAAGSPAGGTGGRWAGATGISGFAFQGTNAHVVLARCVFAV